MSTRSCLHMIVLTMYFFKILKNCTTAVIGSCKLLFVTIPKWYNLHDGQFHNLLDLILLSGSPGYPEAIR